MKLNRINNVAERSKIKKKKWLEELRLKRLLS